MKLARFGKLLSGAAIVAALSWPMAGSALAAGATVHYGPFASTSPDSGTCGNNWANDTFDRFFRVDTTQNPDGTFNVTEDFKNGTFVTIAGPSPEGCGKDPGGTVDAGVQGKLQGSFDIVVSNGAYNPDAVCTLSACGATAGFIATVFGASATYNVTTFNLHYNAKNDGQWKNASANRGGDEGDITGS